MKRNVILILCLFCFVLNTQAGSYFFRETQSFYSADLADTVYFDIHLPEEYREAPQHEFPVLILLDSQNEINHRYHLETIEYLTAIGAMPGCVIVSIPLDNETRIDWTVPAAENGLGDAFLTAITREIDQYIRRHYRTNNFRLLIGHSRTAIFSMYALSARPDYFTGVIASSASYFDFGSVYQKEKFDAFLEKYAGFGRKKFFYFSSGTDRLGDAHEATCDTLDAYLKKQKNIDFLQWKYFKEPAGHYSVPGLTVNRALNEIFEAYQLAVRNCFIRMKDKKKASKVDWAGFREVYAEASEKLGYTLSPDLSFFFSVASAYSNDYDGYFGENAQKHCLEVLLEGEKQYPRHCDLLGWIAEIYTETDPDRAALYTEKIKTCDRAGN